MLTAAPLELNCWNVLAAFASVSAFVLLGVSTGVACSTTGEEKIAKQFPVFTS